MTNKNNNIIDNHAELLLFDEAIELVKDEIDMALSTAPPIIRKYTEHLKLSRGKYIRAQALLACAENKENLIHKDAVKFAAGIEILHLATLVHDDVIDNAPLRRGNITLQKKYGQRTAVICGDYLLVMAFKKSAEVKDQKYYLDFQVPDYASQLCLGELRQHINNNNYDLSIYEYLKIISGKTAALFESAFLLGGIVSEGKSEVLKQYKKLGRYIGMIFQLMDDCIDFEASEEIAKKPVQSDLEQGVITLPLIHAFNTINGFKEKVKSKISRKEINEAVIQSGGIDFTKMVANKYYNKSLEIINALEITQEKRKRLLALLDKASGRVRG